MKHAMIELPDDFEKGDCENCPFSYYDFDGFDGCDCMCVFRCHPDNCSIEVKEDDPDIKTGRMAGEYADNPTLMQFGA